MNTTMRILIALGLILILLGLNQVKCQSLFTDSTFGALKEPTNGVTKYSKLTKCYRVVIQPECASGTDCSNKPMVLYIPCYTDTLVVNDTTAAINILVRERNRIKEGLSQTERSIRNIDLLINLLVK